MSTPPYGVTPDYIELFTADLHLLDARAAASRGYVDTEAHTHAVITNVGKAIMQAHIGNPNSPIRLWVLGDISSGKSMAVVGAALSRLDNLFSYLRDAYPDLKLTTVLLLGNHDSGSQMQPWGIDRRQLFTAVFDVVSDNAVLNINGQQVLLAHLPYERMGDGPKRHGGDPTYGPRHLQWRLPDHDLPMIHAHTHHDTPHVESQVPEQLDYSMICVSYDAWQHQLGVATLEDIKNWIAKYHAHRDTYGEYPQGYKYNYRRAKVKTHG